MYEIWDELAILDWCPECWNPKVAEVADLPPVCQFNRCLGQESVAHF